MLPSSGDEVRCPADKSSAPYARAQGKDPFQAGVDMATARRLLCKPHKKEKQTPSYFLPPPHPWWVAVSNGNTTATSLQFPPPKRSLPQPLKRSSLTAVIKSWSKN